MKTTKAYGITVGGLLSFGSINLLKRDALNWARKRVRENYSLSDADRFFFEPTKILKKYEYELVVLEIKQTPWFKTTKWGENAKI